ncbi:thioredoxin domain-containing protein [Candidatus Woesearchaeota archaeon]|nr:thioredoxin domain-containing protein [Candidatus Woesearchaeota archaeon]
MNRLASEKSPYLQQHAHNPVDWHPWGEEAFAKAKRENKPVFLSIGYSSCHWCHVMEQESFMDSDVAELLNEVFVCVKVDREERPDIDSLYMAACQMLTGSGGWPLTVLLAPDKRPFFAATYIPKISRHGQLGMYDLIPMVKELWTLKGQHVLQSAEQITASLKEAARTHAGTAPGEQELHLCYTQLEREYDDAHGGFGYAPKFPSPHQLLFLLRYWRRFGKEGALRMVTGTLDAMARGGIFDQLGYGFHRYSTDAEWRLPHFEKMLYDQAMLSLAYLECYQATGDQRYAEAFRKVAEYVLRDLSSPEGVFYSSEDADSEGEEGKFYLWTEKELDAILGKDAALARKLFGTLPEGNVADEASGKSTGSNVLIGAEDGEEKERIRRALLQARNARKRPLRDDKVLTDWNGLMIAAFARGSAVLGDPSYATHAKKAADFLLQKMHRDGRLLHRYRDEAGIDAFADDYAFLVFGLLELYEATFEEGYLEKAMELNREFIARFWDADGGFFLTASDGEQLPVRQKDAHDGAIPSANSMAMLNLLRLSRMTGDVGLEEKAAALSRAFPARQHPAAYCMLLCAVDFALGSMEVVISGGRGALLDAVRRTYAPSKVLMLRTERLVRLVPALSSMNAEGTAAFVCRNFSCDAPVSDPELLREKLRA